MFSKRALRYHWRNGDPVITSAIMAVCVFVWLLEVLLSLLWPAGLRMMVAYGAFMPVVSLQHPWTFITSMFMHDPSGVVHILFNMLTLWSVAPMLERMMGHLPFLALYMLAGLGGGAGMMVWASISPDSTSWLTSAYGASGALFGLFAAILVVFRRVGYDIRSMLIWMGINFLMPFLIGGIAWQAHLGGFVCGGALTWLMVSGIRALRGKSIAYRTVVYGVVMLLAIIAVSLLCNIANPLLLSWF